MEENNQENKNYNKGIRYFIEPNKVYQIVRNDYNGRAYYKIRVETTNANKETMEGYKNVSFNGDISLENGTLIKIKSGFESFYFRRGDRFNPVFTLVITDFDYANTDEIPQDNKNNNSNFNDYEDFDNF